MIESVVRKVIGVLVKVATTLEVRVRIIVAKIKILNKNGRYSD